MLRFGYRATDENGLEVEGDLSAPSIDVARQELAHRGWQVIELSAMEREGEAPAEPFVSHVPGSAGASPSPDLPLGNLGGSDAEMLAGQMANVTGAGLPLSAGLRALSEEVPSHRVRRWLRAISDRLERGQSLGAVAREAEGAWPRYFLAMLFAGQRTGKLPMLLNECVVNLRTTAEVRRELWVSMAYPAMLIFAAWQLLSFLASTILPQFRDIFMDFGTELPGITVAILAWSDVMRFFAWWALPALIVVIWLAWIFSEPLGYERWRDALVSHIPLFGEARRSAALGEFSRLLSMLVRYEVGLPEAVRLAAGSVRDVDLREACFELSTRVQAGESLSEAATQIGQFPRELVHLFRWADRGEDFAEGLQNAGEVLSAQSRVHAHTLAIVCEPAVTITIGISVGFTVIALFMPLVKLLNDLS
ncbi:MAG: type II secretion system F family protein [Planctomycetaceae bacterium]|nr:type II secretion system F family protein [Planctomycetaceae bacterium]